MKKIVLLLALATIALAFVGCGSAKVTDKELTYCDGSDLLFRADMIKNDPNFSARDPLFAATKEVIAKWDKTKQVDKSDNQYMVKKDRKDPKYYRIVKGCNRNDLYLVQFGMDRDGKMTSPIRFLKGEPPLNNSPFNLDEKGTNNQLIPASAIRAKPWMIMAYPMNDSTHAKSFYDPKNIKISWDLEYPVLEVIQWKSSNYEPLHYTVTAGVDYVMVDNDGQYIQLLIEYPTGIAYFEPNNKTELRNLRAIANYASSEPVNLLEIQPLMTKVTTTEVLVPVSNKVKKYGGNCIYNGGCVYVLVEDMKKDNDNMVQANKSPTLYERCLIDGDISTDTDDKARIRVGWDYLKSHSTSWLQKAYAGKVRR